MNLPNKWSSNLVGKDKIKAQQAAEHILNVPDLDAWKCLVDNADYLFGYIKERAGQNIVKAAKSENLENMFSLLKFHSPDWDYYIAEAFAKFADDNLSLRILELLKSGSPEEKAYAARYFSVVSFEDASDALFASAQEDYEPLKTNSAQALGKINDKKSYDFFIEQLNTDDDWKKVEAAQFLSNYGNRDAVIPILGAVSSSGMGEYLAGEAASLVDLFELFGSDNKQEEILALEAFDNIISGLAEIWTLGVLLDFKVYECVEKLINLVNNNPSNDIKGKYSQLLLKCRHKVTLFIENFQYTYDEEKYVLSELEEIYQLLFCEDDNFWNQQVENLCEELKVVDEKRKLSAISIIGEIKLINTTKCLINLLSNLDNSESVICEAILALAKLERLNEISDPSLILSRIKDKNLLAIAQSSLGI